MRCNVLFLMLLVTISYVDDADGKRRASTTPPLRRSRVHGENTINTTLPWSAETLANLTDAFADALAAVYTDPLAGHKFDDLRARTATDLLRRLLIDPRKQQQQEPRSGSRQQQQPEAASYPNTTSDNVSGSGSSIVAGAPAPGLQGDDSSASAAEESGSNSSAGGRRRSLTQLAGGGALAAEGEDPQYANAFRLVFGNFLDLLDGGMLVHTLVHMNCLLQSFIDLARPAIFAVKTLVACMLFSILAYYATLRPHAAATWASPRRCWCHAHASRPRCGWMH